MKTILKLVSASIIAVSANAQTPIMSNLAGTGSTPGGYVTRYDGAYTIRNSSIYSGPINNGIGTATPTNPLHVEANNNSGYGILVKQISTGPAAVALANSNTGGRHWAIHSSGPGSIGGAGNFVIHDVTLNQTRFAMNSSGNALFGDPSAISPLAKLHVHDGALRLTGAVAGMGGPTVIWGGNAVTAPNGEWALEYQTAVPGFEGLNYWRPFGATGTTGNYFLFLANTGRVGINTNNPTAQLTVNGNALIGDPTNVTLPAGYKLYVQTGILTEKVKVALTTNLTDWADYVFDKDYKLRTIEEVSEYINENKHLPGVPSTKELVEQGGIDLAKMDAKLMEKVEELTLYIIELKKEIENQKQEIKNLQNRK